LSLLEKLDSEVATEDPYQEEVVVIEENTKDQEANHPNLHLGTIILCLFNFLLNFFL
jgi:hypothetical protein